MFLRRTDRIRAALDCSKFVGTYGEPTELPTEIEIHRHPGSEAPAVSRLKFWVQSVSSDQGCNLHLDRIITGEELYTLGWWPPAVYKM